MPNKEERLPGIYLLFIIKVELFKILFDIRNSFEFNGVSSEHDTAVV
jgi:hypothetical protein